jgi:ADP-ribose pyrophosphatase YjhB (NUDIX family)
MSAPLRFNVRVYGIWIHEGKLLVNEEFIRGKDVIKFPGGGLDLGEGTIDGLKREFQEELQIDIEVLEHFYTTDFYQHSAYDDSQVISIYYLVSGEDPAFAITNHEANERTYWMPLHEVSEATFTLPIDKAVGKMLQILYSSGSI